ncbi:MAG: hypothetical protein K9L83_10450 [Deltaproteobacteria bacterium]|nr:hypothetical protein [Deltaproteobacteria bacterium]
MKAKKSLSGKISVGAKLSAEVEAIVERAHTGRCSSSDELDKLAQEWCEHPNESHEGAEVFLEMLNSFPRMHNGPVVCFRGRRGDSKKITGWENMGPPLNGSEKGGRYDEPGSIVLYTCSRKDAVAREMPGNGILWIQEYALPTDTLTILDVRPSQNRKPGFIDSVFDLAESSCLEGREGRDDFKFSQLIARLVARAGFDGFNAPGVRGERGFWYSNIVIFKPGEAWKDWSRRDEGFERHHEV